MLEQQKHHALGLLIFLIFGCESSLQTLKSLSIDYYSLISLSLYHPFPLYFDQVY